MASNINYDLRSLENHIFHKVNLLELWGNFMIGICHKCQKSNVQIIKTTVLINEVGTATIPLCEECRNH